MAISWHLRVALATFFFSSTFGHYTFPNLIYNGVKYGDYRYIRQTWNRNDYYPLFDLDSTVLRCFQDGSVPDPGTLSVYAGDTIGFVVAGRIVHEGPLLFYMARAPSGSTAASMQASGPVWFKINETTPYIGFTPKPIETYTWPHYNASEVYVQIPKCLRSGDYLLRIEHIALHIAFDLGQHEFFGSCAQLRVRNSGRTVVIPEGSAEFPGAYKSEDPGLHVDIHDDWVQPQKYVVPGPPVWKCP